MIDFILCSPVLGNVKAPFEFKMLVLVIVDKGGYGGVVASGKHAGWCVFLSDYSKLLVGVLYWVDKPPQWQGCLHLFS